jgi:hypothetical protein
MDIPQVAGLCFSGVKKTETKKVLLGKKLKKIYIIRCLDICIKNDAAQYIICAQWWGEGFRRGADPC